MNTLKLFKELYLEVDRVGFVEIRASQMKALAGSDTLQDWNRFLASWDNLPLDTYMGDGGTYRRRRFGVFQASADFAKRQAHQPHYQSRNHNALNGGIDRWFEPIEADIGSHPVIQGLLNGAVRIIQGTGDVRTWHAEVHQFRIEATRAHAGLPTPEGLHRDGVDWVVMMLADRCNIVGGISEIYDLKGEKLASFTLEQPFDSVLLDDKRVLHGVTPVFANDAGPQGRRDILVVTFRSMHEGTQTKIYRG